MAKYSSVENIVRITGAIDQSSVFTMVNTFDKGINNAQRLAVNRIKLAIKHEVLDSFVRALCLRAGPGWPQAYTDHLVAVIQSTIATDMPAAVSKDRTTIDIFPDFNRIGDTASFRRGYHYQALTSLGDRIEGHDRLGISDGHHGYNPHPGRIELPYSNQPLLVTDERRTEFWNRVVIDRDFTFELLLRRGKGNWILADHMDRMGYTISTFDEVALARTLAWGNKAPQWLLLENGTGAGTKPIIKPTDFLRSIGLAGNCVASAIYQGAVTTLIELAESAGVRTGTTGLPYAPASGQFVGYKELLDINVPDYSHCFGRI